MTKMKKMRELWQPILATTAVLVVAPWFPSPLRSHAAEQLERPAIAWHAPAASAPIPLCASDDGSGPRPCRWDAKHQGNGKGQSFTVHRRHGHDVFVSDK